MTTRNDLSDDDIDSHDSGTNSDDHTDNHSWAGNNYSGGYAEGDGRVDWMRQTLRTLQTEILPGAAEDRRGLTEALRARLEGRNAELDPDLRAGLELLTAPELAGPGREPIEPRTRLMTAAVLEQLAIEWDDELDEPEDLPDWLRCSVAGMDHDELASEGPAGESGTVDPILTWHNEAWRLRQAVHDAREARATLEDQGYRIPGDIADVLLAPRVCSDRDRVRAVVQALGGEWSGQGYEACYEAALAEQRRLDGHLDLVTLRPTISGLTGADPLTKGSLRGQVQLDLSPLPQWLRGRDALTNALKRRITDPGQGMLVLAGHGGSGKSSLALTVSHMVGMDHQVWWVAAGDQNQVTRGMLAVASCLSAPVVELNAIQSRPAEGLEMLWRRLEASPTPWLLVFDDVGDPAVLDVPGCPGLSWIRPSRAGTVAITTRSRYASAWQHRAEVIEVTDLSPEAGAEALLDRLGDQHPTVERRDEARRLSWRLGGVALSIQIAGAYLSSAYAREDLAALTDALGPPVAPGEGGKRESARIAEIWEHCLTALSGAGLPHARGLLALLASLEPYWVIPLELLAPDRLSRCGLDAPGVDWQAALDGLCAVGLITRRQTAGERVDGVAVHPLVAEFTREMNHAEHRRITAAAVALLLEEVGDLDAGRPVTWPMLRRLEPHVHALLDHLTAAPKGPADRDDPTMGVFCVKLANGVARGLLRAGLYSAAEHLVVHARECTSYLADDCVESLDAEYVIALARGLGRDLVDAERRFTWLLERCEAAGASQRFVLLVRDRLAWVLAEQGRLDDALERYSEVLPWFNEEFGPDHPATLAVRHRAAWIISLRGRPAEAEKQFEDLLPRRTEALGADHIDVFSSRYRLAWSRYAQGKHAEAFDGFTDLLGDLKAVFPDEATQITMVHAKRGCVRAWMGDLVNAEADLQHVIDTWTQTLGASHARTLHARFDLAWVKIRGGDFQQAEQLCRNILAEVERPGGLGSDHPLSLDVRGRLTRVLLELGQLEDAARLARAQVANRSRICGHQHPEALRARYVLGRVLLEQGRYADADEHLSSLLVAQTDRLGEDHRDTLETRASIAELCGRRGRLAEAETQAREILRCRRRQLDPTSTEILASREQLVWLLGERGRIAEAQRECRALIEARTAVQGALHPGTLGARYRLQWLAALADRPDQARYGYEALAHQQLQVLGPTHPHTLRTRHGWALELIRARRYDEAGRELRETLATRSELLGRVHPDTLTNRHALALLLAVTGSPAEAERSLRSVLVDQTAALGNDHRHTLCTRERLYWVMDRRGRPGSLRRWRTLLSERERALGADHPDTQRVHDRLVSPDYEVRRMWW